ncbi:MAG: hypothetical protein VX501_04835, partial [Pseudomonadota bacterium]|nr:hypothetical protein [Pseudomonadota bacterium]
MNWQFLPQISGACEAVSVTETERTHPNTPEKPESLKPPCSVVRVPEISLMVVEKQGFRTNTPLRIDPDRL